MDALPKNHLGVYRTTQPGVYRVNTSRVQGLDGTKVEDLTKAELEGRRQAFELLEFFRKYFPGFENATLIDTATQIGIRETRRIVGEYVLTADDLVTGRAFDDVIALYGYPIDIHSPDEVTTEFAKTFHTANIYQLPYRILVPQKTDGLLVAGRCVSATHEALWCDSRHAVCIRAWPSCGCGCFRESGRYLAAPRRGEQAAGDAARARSRSA